jgi:23S rRNA (guanine745-N1)-methyltransferase
MRAHEFTGGGGGPAPAAPGQRRAALISVLPYLRCPVCTGRLRLLGSRLACAHGHAFDIARHGYVNLASGQPAAGTADSADMVRARDGFLGHAHYEPIAEAIASLASRHDPEGPGLVADLAGGTGYYLARVLDALPERDGLCVDLSAPALRRAARAHARAAAIGGDVWRRLPLADGCAAHVLSVFGPRNAAETSRILVPGGTLTIAVPCHDHLRELRERLGLIGIEQRKRERIADAFRDYAQAGETSVRREMLLDRAGLAALVSMGPSARHITPSVLSGRIDAMPVPAAVTMHVMVSAWRRRARRRSGGPARARARNDPGLPGPS